MDFIIWVTQIYQMLEGTCGFALAIACIIYFSVEGKIDRSGLLAFAGAVFGLTLFFTMYFLLQVSVPETMEANGFPYLFRGFMHGFAAATVLFVLTAILNRLSPLTITGEKDDTES